MQQTTELNNTLGQIITKYDYLRSSPPLRMRENFISKITKFACKKEIKIDQNLLQNLNLLMKILSSNWLVPPTPKLENSFKGEAVLLFDKIVANRSLTARQLQDIRVSQLNAAYRKALNVNYKQRSDSLKIAMDLQSLFDRIHKNIDTVSQIYRSCSGPQTLLRLAFTQCPSLLASINQHSYTVEEYACHPSRQTIRLQARIHQPFRIFDPSVSDVIMFIGTIWTGFHGLLLYAYIGLLVCRRLSDRLFGRAGNQGNMQERQPMIQKSGGLQKDPTILEGQIKDARGES